MKRSNRLVLLIGALLAVVAFVGVILLLGQGTGGGGPQATPTAPTTAQVVKATVDIPAGTVVTSTMVDVETVPIAASADSIPDPGLVIGKTIRENAKAGSILSFSAFVDTGQTSNVTDNIPQGLRAMAVEVDQVTGVGTLIHTGDTVDLIIAMDIQSVVPDPKNAPQVVNVGTPQSTVKMIIQNLQGGRDSAADPDDDDRRGDPAAGRRLTDAEPGGDAAADLAEEPGHRVRDRHGRGHRRTRRKRSATPSSTASPARWPTGARRRSPSSFARRATSSRSMPAAARSRAPARSSRRSRSPTASPSRPSSRSTA